MQNNIPHSYIRLLSILMVIISITVGCTKEELSRCNPFEFTVRAYGITGNDITESGDVKEIKMYVFDDQEKFLAVHQAELGADIVLEYDFNEKLNIVVWGNSASDKQIVPTPKVGDKLDDTFISLITTTRSSHPNVKNPDDLFHGIVNIIKNDINSPKEVTIRRKVASVIISSKGLKEYVKTTSDNFTYVLRSKNSHVNFKGHATISDANHNPNAEFKTDGLFESDIFNILSDSQNNIEVDIYNGENLVTTVTKDNNGNLLSPKEGELLNIYVNFMKDINISIVLTPWGEKEIWKEF